MVFWREPSSMNTTDLGNTGQTVSQKTVIARAIVLAILAVAGNAANITLFYSVSFILGSIFSLVAVRILGLGWGVLIGLIGSAYTMVLWGHPYAMLVFTLEVLFVGLVLRRYDHLAIADTLFWILVGLPAVTILYSLGLGQSTDSASYIAVKQAVNGVFNAVIAGLLLAVLRLKISKAIGPTPTISLQSLSFKVLAFVGIFSCMIVVVLDSRTHQREAIERVEDTLAAIADWTEAEVARQRAGIPRVLSSDVLPGSLLKSSNIDFDAKTDLAMTFLDRSGRLIGSTGNALSLSDSGSLTQVTPNLQRWEPSGQMPALRRTMESRYVFIRSIETDQGPAEIRLELALAQLVTALEHKSRNTLFVLATVIVLVLGISYLMISLLVRPFQRLSQSSKELSNAILSGSKLPTLELSQINELDTLAIALGDMALSLSEAFKEQEALTRNLEDQVQRRTARLAQMSQAVQQTKDSVVMTDTEGRITWVNPAFEETTGYTLDELLGEVPGRLLQKVRPPHEMVEHMKACVANAKSFHVELLNHSKDGKPYWVEIRSNPLFGPEGKHIGFLAIQTDITDRRQLTKSLEDSLARMQLATKVAELGVWSYTPKTEVLEWDDLNYQLHGITPPASGSLRDTWLAQIVPEDRSRISAIFDLKSPSETGAMGAEYRYRHPVLGELIMAVSFRRINLHDGTQTITGVTRDITLERTSEQKLRDAANHTAAILDNVIDAVIAIDENGLMTSYNRAAERMFGYAADEVIGNEIAMLMPSEHATSHGNYIKRFIHTGHRRIMGRLTEFEAVRKNGERFPIQLAVSQVLATDQHVFIGIIRDATKQRELEEQLRQSQKLEAVGQLTGGIAHDFNNLLTIILGSAETVLDGLDQNSKLRRPAEMALLAAERGAQLTDRLLSFSRRQPLSPQLIDVSDLVMETRELLTRSITQEIEIKITSSKSKCLLEIDPNQLQSAILNLVLNARDALQDGGTIELRTEILRIDEDNPVSEPGFANGTYVVISVSDNGIGMDERQLSHAFEPFFTTKEIGKGSGLGLSMVFGFVKQSGGHIRIESQVGRGTTVRLFFPSDQTAEDMNILAEEMI